MTTQRIRKNSFWSSWMSVTLVKLLTHKCLLNRFDKLIMAHGRQSPHQPQPARAFCLQGKSNFCGILHALRLILPVPSNCKLQVEPLKDCRSGGPETGLMRSRPVSEGTAWFTAYKVDLPVENGRHLVMKYLRIYTLNNLPCS